MKNLVYLFIDYVSDITKCVIMLIAISCDGRFCVQKMTGERAYGEQEGQNQTDNKNMDHRWQSCRAIFVFGVYIVGMQGLQRL